MTMGRTVFSAVVVALFALLVAGPAWAVEFEFDLTNTVEAGGEPATLTIRAVTDAENVTVELLRGDGHRQTEELGDLNAGDARPIVIEQPPGRFDYSTTIRTEAADGQWITMDFDFQVVVSSPVELEVDLLRDEVDLDAAVVPVVINQPVDRVEVEVLDKNGMPLVRVEDDYSGQSGRLDIRWEPRGEPAVVRLTLHYGGGAWYRFTLRPFWIEIPQQIINFETGSATIAEGEGEKLIATRDRIREALADVEEEFRGEMQLYVAGYTDTVGSAANNLALSTRRARALARWFRDNGVDMPIYYQGFGQEVLAVDTPDQTEERRNRRARYLLGNAPPPTSEQYPRANWQRLP